MNTRFDLTDRERELIERLLPRGLRGARRVDDRRVLDAIFYVLRAGCRWRDLPELLDRPGPPLAIVADKAYDSRAVCHAIRDDGALPVIQARSTARAPEPRDQCPYRRRNIVERFFCRRKDLRRIATRSDKLCRMWKPEHRVAVDGRGLRCPSDLSDGEWAPVGPLIPPARHGGRHREMNVREVLNAVCCVLSTGCQWQALPGGLPRKGAAHSHFVPRDWDGTLERIHHALHVALRKQAGGAPSPTAAVIDSQSAGAAQEGAGVDLLRRSRRLLPLRQAHPRRWRRPGAEAGRERRQDRRLEAGNRYAHGTASLRRPAQALGGRAHLRLDRSQPASRARLRTLRQNRRRLRPFRDDPPHAPALDAANPLHMNFNFPDWLLVSSWRSGGSRA